MADTAPSIGVIDASTFGTTLADTFAVRHKVSLGCDKNFIHEGKSLLEQMVSEGRNVRYLPDYRLSENIEIKPIEEVVGESDILVIAVPTKYLRDSARRWARLVKPEAVICSATKGIEIETFMRPTKVIRDVMNEVGKDSHIGKERYASISGPTFSASFRQKRRLSANLAVNDRKLGSYLKDALSVEHRLNLHLSPDVKGNEYAGALKNVYACGAGCMSEFGYSEDEFETYMTFAANEMANMLDLLGCQERTILSLAGIGDLNMTSRSDKSRNFRAGRELARTGRIDYSSEGGVVEGYNTIDAIRRLFIRNGKERYARRYFKVLVDIYDAMHGNKTPSEIKGIFDNMLSYYQSGIPFQKTTIIKRFYDAGMRHMLKKKYEK